MMTNLGKPLVVIAGWLGCQKRSLRRYERFFESHGYQVLSTIAPPSMVVASCLESVPPPAIRCPPWWPLEAANMERTSSMQDQAWNLLRQVQDRNCECFLFYALSNGGCFLWEQFQRILNLSMGKETLGEEQRELIESIRKRTAGVIFDSCPGLELSGIGQALALCSVRERLEVMMSHGLDVAFFPAAMSQTKRMQLQTRGRSYYDGLLNDPSHVPQLYLYSESDPLIPSAVVDQLFEHRREKIGHDRVFRRKFGSTRHCAHFIDSPEEYATAVQTFLETCHPRPSPTSKL